MEPEILSFEAAYDRLEEIVRQLESDDLAIDRAVELYELGVRLVRHCSRCLDGAELRIKRLAQTEDGELGLADMPYPN